MTRHPVDVWVGALVLLSGLALIFLVLQSANLLQTQWSGDTYQVRARFDNIGGLKPKAAVKAAGVVVGRVRSIELNGTSYQAEVVIDLDGRYLFPRDSSLRILTSGLLGEQYVGIGAGFEDKYWGDGEGVSRTQSAVVLENLIGQFLMNAANREGSAAQ